MFSVITLNIEKNRHLPAVISTLTSLEASVICLQEVLQSDVSHLASGLGMPHSLFIPDVKAISPNIQRIPVGGTQGILILSRDKPKSSGAYYYVGDDHSYLTFVDGDNRPTAALVWVNIHTDNHLFTIITTHFTWSPQGLPSTKQYQDLASLLVQMQKFSHGVLCGDFNAPRGGPIWGKLASNFTDNVPASVKTTIDGNHHKAGHLPYVVDGIFSFGNHVVSGVKVITGVSDHYGLHFQVDHR